MNENSKYTALTPAEKAETEYQKAKALAKEAAEQSKKALAEAENGTGQAQAEKRADGSKNCEAPEASAKAENSPQVPEAPKKKPMTEEQKYQYLYRVEKMKNKHKKAYTAASVLSACSILLLLGFFLCLLMGIIPIGNTVIALQVSNGGPIKGEVYEDRATMLEDAKRSVVVVSASGTGFGGTGFVLSKDGYIVTNYHVIEGATGVQVRLYGEEKKTKASIVGFSVRDDIAVLKIEKTDLRPMIFAKQADCRVGEDVYALGTPDGPEFGWSVSRGIISALNRELKIYASDGALEKKMYVVQTDAPVNHGNSGGPLINARGEVVGIVTLKLPDNEGMGFALPSDGVLELISAIIETGSTDGVVSSVSKAAP